MTSSSVWVVRSTIVLAVFVLLALVLVLVGPALYVSALAILTGAELNGVLAQAHTDHGARLAGEPSGVSPS